MTDTLAAHALAFAANGWEVFPLLPNKAPGTRNGFHDATCDLERVATWWERQPDALIGHRIPQGVLLLDFDPRHGALDVHQALESHFGLLPETRMHYSGRGDRGFHLWLRIPDGTEPTTRGLNRWAQQHGVGHEPAPGKWSAGIDLLHHDLRYTILPPSPHPSGRGPYRWAPGGAEAPIADCPDWLLDLLTAPPEPDTIRAPSTYTGPSVAEWFCDRYTWPDVLGRHGWTVAAGDGDSDGSKWRHPNATADNSASIRHHQLFVYSDNTPFPVTGSNAPAGISLFRAKAILDFGGDESACAAWAWELPGAPPPPEQERRRKAQDFYEEIQGRQDHQGASGTVETPEPGPNPILAACIDWGEFWATDHHAEEWLCEPVIAQGRGHAIYAGAKTGKSLLVLELVTAIATGAPFLDQPAGDPIDVLYLDYEMTGDDLFDRLATFGHGPDTDLSRLHYAQFPAAPPLNTVAGGQQVLEAAQAVGAQLVIIDTTSRAVDGDENDAKTYQDFYRLCGMILKREGIAWVRIDHAGKELERGQRGSSAKNDDVDVVWTLVPRDDGLTLKATHRRMGWVPEFIDIVRDPTSTPLHRRTAEVWPEGTGEIAKALDDLGAPMGITRREARELLRDRDVKVGDRTLQAAIKWRKTRASTRFSDAMKVHEDAPRQAPRQGATPTPRQDSAPARAKVENTPEDAGQRPAPRFRASPRQDQEASAPNGALYKSPMGEPGRGGAAESLPDDADDDYRLFDDTDQNQ